MKTNKAKAIYFDMDGTIADLYGVDGWLDDLINRNTRPYKEAKVMLNMNVLARKLNALQRKGYTIGVITWLPKNANDEYNEEVEKVKRNWLKKHLKTVKWNKIHVVTYGTPKQEVVNEPLGILFDDEERNRVNWKGQAFGVDNIIDILKRFA